MKNYINIFQKLVLLLAVIVASSCIIDDIKPEYQLTPENTIRDEKSAQQVLNGVYYLGRTFDLGFFPLHLAGYGIEGTISGISGEAGFNTNQVLPENNRFLTNLYNAHYKIINSANFLIEELEAGKAKGISEQRKVEMISEAKFQRAFAHFNLLRYFGEYYDQNSAYGMVLRTSFSLEVEASPRNTVEETYTLMIKDLEYASTNGPVFIEHFYSGSLAAKALLAKVKLYQGDFTQAASLAKEVIDNQEGYELEAVYDDIFYNRFHSSEVIFAPFAAAGQEGGSGMDQSSRTTYSEILRSLADIQVGGSNDGSLDGQGSNYEPRFAYAYADVTKGFNNQGKYPNDPTSGSEGNTLYHLRLAEIYLVHAEAIARSGEDPTIALGSLNTIRDRAGVTPKQFSDVPTLLEDIRQEKLLELFFENGEPLFDLVRYDILGNLNAADIKPTLNDKTKFILPIPADVLIGNSNLVQNPGY